MHPWCSICAKIQTSPWPQSSWGNVTINVLLTLLSDSILAGVGAFVFSTIVITLFGEIIPQAMRRGKTGGLARDHLERGDHEEQAGYDWYKLYR